jgi:Carbohydrate family 9 binding domain-like
MKKRPLLAVAVLLSFVLLVVSLTALLQTKDHPSDVVVPPYVPPRGYVCYRATQPIRIDGRIDDEAWQAAPWSEPFVDIEGDKRPLPRFRTRMKMLWDDEQLYIAAELEELHVWATLTKHDSVIFHDNDFEVFLDPDGDNHLYAELELNALNTTWDLLLPKPYKDGGRAIDAWEIAGLKTAVHIDGTINDPRDTDRGWTVEIAWPWRGLKELTTVAVPPRDGDQWRINFSRVQWQHEIVDGKYQKVAGKREDNWVWSPQHAINMHLPEHWGILQFSTAPPGTAEFRSDPCGSARHALHRIHDAQVNYRKKHGRYATTLAALGMANLRDPSFSAPRLETTANFYEARVDVGLPDGKRETWTMTSDGRISKK